MPINDPTVYLPIIAVLVWGSVFFNIYIFIFRQPINIHMVKNFEQDYVLGRSYWFPEKNKGLVTLVFKIYFKLRKKPIPEPINMPFRSWHNDNIKRMNNEYADEIKDNPKIFGLGWQVMYVKTKMLQLLPKTIYYLSPLQEKYNEYHIYGYPPTKINELDPMLNHWVIYPDLNLINADAKLKNLNHDFIEETADNRTDIGDQVEIGMLGDPDQVKELHRKGTLLNPWINEKSQVSDFIKELKTQDYTKEQMITKLKDRFGIVDEDE